MIALGVIIAVLLLISLLRLGVIAEYSQDGLTADAYIAFVHIRVYPSKAKKKRKPRRKEKKIKAEKSGRLATLKGQLPAILKAILKLKRRMRINHLTVHYIAASSDPSAAALSFGAVNVGFGMILPILENNFNIAKRDLRTAVNFDASEPYIYVKAKISLAVWEAPVIVIGLIRAMSKTDKLEMKIRKAV